MDSIEVTIGSKSWEFTPNEAQIVQRELRLAIAGSALKKKRDQRLQSLSYDDIYTLLEPFHPDQRTRKTRTGRLFNAIIRLNQHRDGMAHLDYSITCSQCMRDVKEPCTSSAFSLGEHYSRTTKTSVLRISKKSLKDNAVAFDTIVFRNIGSAVREDMRHLVALI